MQTTESIDGAPVRPAQLEPLAPPADAGPSLLAGGIELVQDVKVTLTLSVGSARMSIAELFALKEGALLELDKAVGDPVDIFLGTRLIARGELMVSGDNFAVRITEIGGRA